MAQTATHYEVLDIPRSLKLSNATLKKAYHRALLRYHPDKAAAEHIVGGGAPGAAESTDNSKTAKYTVDEILLAYNTLLSPQLRKEYDLSLEASKNVGKDGGNTAGPVDSLDLDDFEMRYENDKMVFTRSCRCGEKEGFLITEDELEELSGEGQNEALVGCVGCSLWFRVTFEVIEGS
ncbi:DnaJ-domain-containing protein [Ascobolus immersus RN42]|uniref:Diphthamide biosynthesis protein 4 n=1 Tax=Ascobolus immersus RN42 TaxID=1160509 RepID=A0A3N4ISJ2_ASCIM|nr:DnaJ-domain-containing protein [Ascobolus immersus RN42]